MRHAGDLTRQGGIGGRDLSVGVGPELNGAIADAVLLGRLPAAQEVGRMGNWCPPMVREALERGERPTIHW